MARAPPRIEPGANRFGGPGRHFVERDHGAVRRLEPVIRNRHHEADLLRAVVIGNPHDMTIAQRIGDLKDVGTGRQTIATNLDGLAEREHRLLVVIVATCGRRRHDAREYEGHADDRCSECQCLHPFLASALDSSASMHGHRRSGRAFCLCSIAQTPVPQERPSSHWDTARSAKRDRHRPTALPRSGNHE